MKKQELIKLFEKVIESIKNDDSIEGCVAYELGDESDTFSVDAFVRVGNSMGQGSCILVIERNVSEEAEFECDSLEEAKQLEKSGDLYDKDLTFTEVCGEVLSSYVEEIAEN